MFLFGILSSPLPYLLMAVFYFFGFATGMFKGNADNEPNTQVQVKNIQFEPQTANVEKLEHTFHFQQYHFQEKVVNCAVQSIERPPIPPNEQLVYFVRDIKIHHFSTSEYYYCRPPPTRS